jgi:hypothetical protein
VSARKLGGLPNIPITALNYQNIPMHHEKTVIESLICLARISAVRGISHQAQHCLQLAEKVTNAIEHVNSQQKMSRYLITSKEKIEQYLTSRNKDIITRDFWRIKF